MISFKQKFYTGQFLNTTTTNSYLQFTLKPIISSFTSTIMDGKLISHLGKYRTIIWTKTALHVPRMLMMTSIPINSFSQGIKMFLVQAPSLKSNQSGFHNPFIFYELAVHDWHRTTTAVLEHLFSLFQACDHQHVLSQRVTVVCMLFKSKLLDAMHRPLRKRADRSELEVSSAVQNRVIKL